MTIFQFLKNTVKCVKTLLIAFMRRAKLKIYWLKNLARLRAYLESDIWFLCKNTYKRIHNT